MSEALPLPKGHGLIRRANRADLPEIVRLLADDPLGQTREAFTSPLPESYYRAFEAIEADPNQFLAVVEQGGRIVGTFQLSFIPGLSRQGAWRAQVEAVRIDHALRNQGLGRVVMEWVIEYARQRGCALVQLTSDKSRKDALRFYQRLGFISSHEGMKLKL
ncbi:MAG: acetyltransferase [Meiothermus sp.]|uniref:Acetyltransferase n=2 Tax=Meiothermus hypogaeus TaxID=884155 RepID=A0A511R0G2_9DEIN|nr:GNAT family N-acetyltransferase [Meiothermus hypogaeus]RIH75525.1 Aminoalkylphosphonate N-acetyltransferase [Meiothermus hypogaeus]GEM83111.1 acetyltransferase [Meiothermus hypogaeus NBRC 106114]GIW38288.1 MAG: acetyltransferase [Meiothermus sp.]